MRFSFVWARQWIGRSWLMLVLLLVIGYFSYHLIHGQHGLVSWRALEEELRIAKTDLKALDTQEAALEHKISLLKTHVDPDLLREQAGRRLNLHHPDDRVLLLQDSNETPSKNTQTP